MRRSVLLASSVVSIALRGALPMHEIGSTQSLKLQIGDYGAFPSLHPINPLLNGD
jgi:hypothetical protein